MSSAEAVIVGAGPVGLFAAFQLGLFGIGSHLVECLDGPGGQCSEFYADKPIHDVPGFPAILAQDLVDRLRQQVGPFNPAFTYGQAIVGFERLADGTFRLATDKSLSLHARVIVLAAGGLSDSLKPASGWGVNFSRGTIPVDTERFETIIPGVFAIGDIAAYPGKLRLLLSGFHEAALMAQAVRRIVAPQGQVGLRKKPG